jgi:hypothetical protein
MLLLQVKGDHGMWHTLNRGWDRAELRAFQDRWAAAQQFATSVMRFVDAREERAARIERVVPAVPAPAVGEMAEVW